MVVNDDAHILEVRVAVELFAGKPAPTGGAGALNIGETMSQAVLAKETNRRQLQQIISGLSDGVILAEVDQSILWANEAALLMHGVEKVEELGANTQEYAARFALRYRNNHPLVLENYPLSRVADGEEFSDVVVEVTPTGDEEKTWVHRLRSLVLTDASGEPELLVLILSDATEWASAEQRFEKTFNANPAPAVICRLSDLRYIKVNQGFLEMTGYSRDQVIGRSVYELDVLEQAENKDLAVKRLGEGSTIPQMQAELKLPEGGSKLVIVAGQPLDMNEEDCMLFSFTDLEPRRKAETALRQSEERFAKSFRLTPVPTLVCNAANRQVVDINEAFMNITGYISEELIGKSIEDIDFIDSPQASTQLFTTLEKAGNLDGLDLKIRKKGSEVIDCVLSADTVSIQDVPCYLLVLMNITERKRSELELVAAIEEVMQDASWFSQTLIEKLANAKSVNSPNVPNISFTDLTARERDVLGLICEGLADKEIASRLKLAPNTVRNHVATVYSKLGVHSRSAAIVWARERGLFAGELRVKKPK
jgi:PAS domain S-box-containing protein